MPANALANGAEILGFLGLCRMTTNGPHQYPLRVRPVNYLIGTAPGKRRVVVANNGFVFLSEDELLSVLGTAKLKAIRDWAMILTTYSHGLRAAETCGLKISDLDLRGGVLSIHRLPRSLSTPHALATPPPPPLLDAPTALRPPPAAPPTHRAAALPTPPTPRPP